MQQITAGSGDVWPGCSQILIFFCHLQAVTAWIGAEPWPEVHCILSRCCITNWMPRPFCFCTEAGTAFGSRESGVTSSILVVVCSLLPCTQEASSILESQRSFKVWWGVEWNWKLLLKRTITQINWRSKDLSPWGTNQEQMCTWEWCSENGSPIWLILLGKCLMSSWLLFTLQEDAGSELVPGPFGRWELCFQLS